MIIIESWGTGGTEQYLSQVGEYLHAHGTAACHLLMLRPSRTNVTPPAPAWAASFRVPAETASARWIVDQVREAAPDVLHLNLYTRFWPTVRILRRHVQLPIVATLHQPLTAWNFRHRWAWRRAIRRCDRIVCNSRATLQSLGGLVDADVIPAAVPLVDRSASDRTPDPHTFRVMGCGRLSPEKDWPTLLRAVARIASTPGEGPLDCELIGDGALRLELEQLAVHLNIADRVRFRGRISHPEVLEAYQQADLCVLPSRFEGLGMSAMESIAAGVPTITSDFPSSVEFIVDGETGHRFPIGDDARLAELIRWHRAHQAESAEMGRKGREAIRETFHPDRTVGRYVEIYRQLVQANRREACVER